MNTNETPLGDYVIFGILAILAFGPFALPAFALIRKLCEAVHGATFQYWP